MDFRSEPFARDGEATEARFRIVTEGCPFDDPQLGGRANAIRCSTARDPIRVPRFADNFGTAWNGGNVTPAFAFFDVALALLR